MTSSLGCPVLSPFDHTCGFIVKPEAWAATYPGFNVPIEYFDGGLYGIVWLNSSAFHVVKPIFDPEGAVIPAVCQIHVPSGTLIMNSTTVKLPDKKMGSIVLPSFSICKSVSGKSSGSDFRDEASASNLPPLSGMSAIFYAPGLPYNCGDCAVYGPEIWAGSLSGSSIFFGELATDSICIPTYCSTYAWTLLAGYGELTLDGEYVIDTNCPGYRGVCR